MLFALPMACADAALVSYLPHDGLARFIAAEWDIRTIRSSINPRRTLQQAHFSDVGLSISEAADARVVLESPDDTFVIQVLSRGDANKDGIEDAVVCFSEQARHGTLASSRPFVLQKYSKSTPLVALAYDVNDPRCR